MPYIPLEEHLPGITGLLEYSPVSGEPIRELTQFLLRGPSTLTEAERELIAVVVSDRNKCRFCMTAHTAAADALLGEHETSAMVKQDILTAPVSDKMKALLTIAAQVAENGKSVTPASIQHAKDKGATDMELHDTVLIASLFCLYNRYVDGLATVTPNNADFYEGMAGRLKEHGYVRLEEGYDHLKGQHIE